MPILATLSPKYLRTNLSKNCPSYTLTVLSLNLISFTDSMKTIRMKMSLIASKLLTLTNIGGSKSALTNSKCESLYTVNHKNVAVYF